MMFYLFICTTLNYVSSRYCFCLFSSFPSTFVLFHFRFALSSCLLRHILYMILSFIF
ncbi:hypothetical protein BC943DRAFT_184849 [Umbelopsis sp. AD052]|nr:hypothetical protein BC943DRAFT_184849 [Umbelopsis sp. AD052]